MNDQDVEAAALIDLTDEIQDEAEKVSTKTSGGGCLTVAVLVIALFLLLKFLA